MEYLRKKPLIFFLLLLSFFSQGYFLADALETTESLNPAPEIELTVTGAGGIFSSNKKARVSGGGFGDASGQVILGNASVFSSCTKTQIQKVTLWTNSVVLFTTVISTKNFPAGSTAYIYVKDSSGAVNASGFGIVIGQDYSDRVPPALVASSPEQGSTWVEVNAPIRLDLFDANPGIRADTLAMYVKGVKVIPVISKFSQNVSLEYVPSVSFGNFQNVAVRIIATDFDNNKLDKSFTFKTVPKNAYPNIAWGLELYADDYSAEDLDNADTVRVLVEGENLAFNASQIALEFRGRKAGDYSIKNVSIAEADLASGAGRIVTGTWKKVLFDKQTNTSWQDVEVLVPAGGLKVSKALTFTINSNKSYYVTFKNISKGVKESAYSDSLALFYPEKDANGNAQDYSLAQNWESASSSPVFNLSKIYALKVISSRQKLFISSENGTVAKNPSQEYYDQGSSVVLTAVPAAGYAFSGWTGDITDTANPITVSIDSEKNIVANFYEVLGGTYTLKIVPRSGSLIGESFTATYNAGASVTLSASPGSGYIFSNWSGDISGTENPVTFVMDGDKNIDANFTPSPSTSLFLGSFAGSVVSFISIILDILKNLY